MKVIINDCITNALCVAEVSTAMVVHGIPVKKEEFFFNAAVRVQTTSSMVIYIVPHDFKTVDDLAMQFAHIDKAVFMRDVDVTAFVDPDEHSVEKIKDLQVNLGVKRGMLVSK